jgi:hypothetical protein
LSPLSGSNEVEDDVDVAARGFRVRTDLLGVLDQQPGYFAIKTWQVDIEADAYEILSIRQMQIDLGVNRDPGHRDLS